MNFKAKLNSTYDRLYDLRERFLGYPKLHEIFKRHNGFDLNLHDPWTYNEWVVHKILFDRDPLLIQTSDKVAVRDYVRQKLGAKTAEEILIPIYHLSKNARDFPEELWQKEFFMKANHGSGTNKLVMPGADPQKTLQLAKAWLNSSYGQRRHEWAYRDIPRKIICEKVIRNEEGDIPMDIKFYCFYGKAKFILFFKGRFGKPSRAFTDPDLQLIHGVQSGIPDLEDIPSYSTHQRMIEIAEILSKPFVHARADFYSVGGKIYFGELTQYSGGGIEHFESYEINLALGLLWRPEYKDKSVWDCMQEASSKY